MKKKKNLSTCDMAPNLQFHYFSILFVAVVQSLGHVQLFVIPWTAAHQVSLFFTVSWSLLKLMSIDMSNVYLLKERWISSFHYRVCIPTCKMWPLQSLHQKLSNLNCIRVPGRLIEKSKVCTWGMVKAGKEPRPTLLRQRWGDAAKKPWVYNPAEKCCQG